MTWSRCAAVLGGGAVLVVACGSPTPEEPARHAPDAAVAAAAVVEDAGPCDSDAGKDPGPAPGPRGFSVASGGCGYGDLELWHLRRARRRFLGETADARPSGGVEIEAPWLARHQSPDGRWDADGFDSQCKRNQCPDPGEPGYDPGVTGLALLAFLGVGETHQSGTYRETVKDGLKYLKNVQDSEGCFGPRTVAEFQFNHLWASAAMTEAYGLTQSVLFKDAAQRGIHFIQQSRNPYLAWRHGVRDGGNDTIVTAWAVLALRSGVTAGLEVDKGAFAGALAWIDRMTDPATGHVRRDESAAPTAAPDAPETATAAALLVRILCHEVTDPSAMRSDLEIRRGTERLLQRLPRWDPDAGTIDFMYWHFGSLAMFRIDGDPWKQWMYALQKAVMEHQRVEDGRDERGSWDAVDPWSRRGGRVYATAMNDLCMEIYYRYPRVISRGPSEDAR